MNENNWTRRFNVFTPCGWPYRVAHTVEFGRSEGVRSGYYRSFAPAFFLTDLLFIVMGFVMLKVYR